MAGVGFREIYFTIGITAEIGYENDDEPISDDFDASRVVSHGARKLFKL